MKGKVTIISGESAKGLIATLEEISKQNQQLIVDNEQFKAENEEFRKELAKPKTLTSKAISWLKRGG